VEQCAAHDPVSIVSRSGIGMLLPDSGKTAERHSGYRMGNPSSGYAVALLRPSLSRADETETAAIMRPPPASSCAG